MRTFLNEMTAGSTVQMLATHNRRIFCPIICDTDLCRCNFYKLRTLVDTPPTRNSNPPTRGDSPLCSRAINTSNPTTVEDYIAHYPNIPNIPPPLTQAAGQPNCATEINNYFYKRDNLRAYGKTRQKYDIIKCQ